MNILAVAIALSFSTSISHAQITDPIIIDNQDIRLNNGTDLKIDDQKNAISATKDSTGKLIIDAPETIELASTIDFTYAINLKNNASHDLGSGTIITTELLYNTSSRYYGGEIFLE